MSDSLHPYSIDVRETYGAWMLNLGEWPMNPERITSWWRKCVPPGRARAEVATARSQALVGDVRHRPRPRHPHANRLGHANPAMTLRVYAHAVGAPDVEVAKALGAALDAPRSE